MLTQFSWNSANFFICFFPLPFSSEHYLCNKTGNLLAWCLFLTKYFGKFVFSLNWFSNTEIFVWFAATTSDIKGSKTCQKMLTLPGGCNGGWCLSLRLARCRTEDTSMTWKAGPTPPHVSQRTTNTQLACRTHHPLNEITQQSAADAIKLFCSLFGFCGPNWTLPWTVINLFIALKSNKVCFLIFHTWQFR